MSCKIATLNLCLGLKNKKESIKRIIIENKIDICCLQETDLESDYPTDILTFKGYSFETEINSHKSRCGIYISNTTTYTRRQDLEGKDSHLVIIDINDQLKTRIINIYRSFNPPHGHTQRNLFENQIKILKEATNPQTIILGDFNLDYNKQFDLHYSHKHYFVLLNSLINEKNLYQIVNFNTWSRNINNVVKSSLLDHIYVNNPTIINNIKSLIPPFGDHVLISFEINSKREQLPVIFKRNWRNYTKEGLIIKLNECNWNYNIEDVQTFWNCFEGSLVDVVDGIAPLEKMGTNNPQEKNLPRNIKNKINKRDRLLKKTIANGSPARKLELKDLNKQIKFYFHVTKSKSIRRGILPGNSKSLWDAVKIASDKNVTRLPNNLFLNGESVSDGHVASSFANFFNKKVDDITKATSICPEVYNGHQKIFADIGHTIEECDILECVKELKLKNCEGFDRIPQRILSDGIKVLSKPLTTLFKMIFNTHQIPEQWLIAKTIPIHKKGPKQNIENYRPVANLCSTTKIFEKLILKRIQKLETLNNIDITGKNQHGFKKKKSTSTLGIQIQSLISRALDEDEYVCMASIDLSSAFDVVNKDLLLKRMRMVGLPEDVISLIRVWLGNRMFYVETNGQTSNFFESNFGTVQGSILGPILYAIFVSPLFDLTELYTFADDNFSLSSSQNKHEAKNRLQAKLTVVTTWLTNSGLKINENKTELCLFYRKDTNPIKIILNDVIIMSKTSINVLGVSFDSKMTWSNQISQTIQKANKALHAIKIIKKYFSKIEITTLLTSNYFSILYYNSEIWHLPTLSPELKQMLLSASANALKLTQNNPNYMQSFIDIHKSCKRALPEQMILYKHAILLYKLYNENLPETDWLALNFQQTTTTRQAVFFIIKNNNFKIGNNILTNRLNILNNKIPLNLLNKSFNTYKIECKKLLLSQ